MPHIKTHPVYTQNVAYREVRREKALGYRVISSHLLILIILLSLRGTLAIAMVFQIASDSPATAPVGQPNASMLADLVGGAIQAVPKHSAGGSFSASPPAVAAGASFACHRVLFEPQQRVRVYARARGCQGGTRADPNEVLPKTVKTRRCYSWRLKKDGSSGELSRHQGAQAVLSW